MRTHHSATSDFLTFFSSVWLRCPKQNEPNKVNVTLIALYAAFAIGGLGTAASGSAASSDADAYPTKPIRFIVPFPPGGGNDGVARAVGQQLTETFGQQVVIDNRAGAGGVIGAEIASKSVPDGYTLFLGGVAPLAIAPGLHAKLGYNVLKDFAPVSLIAISPHILVVHPSVPAKSVSELIQLATQKPGTLNFASNGLGSSSHLAAEMLLMMTSTNMIHIPYKGLSPAMVDLSAGQVQLMFGSVFAMLPHVRSGKVRPLAVTGGRRSPVLPDVPTVAESGVVGYESGTWYGVIVPAGTPRSIVDKLASQVARISRSAEMRKRLATDGAEPIGGTPNEFALYIKRELARWAKVIKRAGIQAK